MLHVGPTQSSQRQPNSFEHTAGAAYIPAVTLVRVLLLREPGFTQTVTVTSRRHRRERYALSDHVGEIRRFDRKWSLCIVESLFSKSARDLAGNYSGDSGSFGRDHIHPSWLSTMLDLKCFKNYQGKRFRRWMFKLAMADAILRSPRNLFSFTTRDKRLERTDRPSTTIPC
jgi:hypothetical protein